VKPRKQPWLVRTLSIAVPGAIILGLVVLYGLISGFPLRFFAGRDYGEVQLTVDLTAFYKGTEEASVSTKLFLDDNAAVPAYEYVPVFLPNWDSENKKLQTIPFHLPSGHYRIKTVVDDYVLWQSFYVASWEAEGAPNKVLQIVKPAANYIIDTRFNISDVLTGALISNSQVFIKRGQTLIDINQLDGLRSGQTYVFEVAAPGYLSQTFDLSIAPQQRRLTISAQLAPRPGLLKIVRQNPNIRLKINDQNVIESYGGRFLINTPLVNEEETTLWLAPGNYTLDFNYRGSSLSRTIGVRFASPTTITIRENDGELSLTN
jgi:hypothetical protein